MPISQTGILIPVIPFLVVNGFNFNCFNYFSDRKFDFWMMTGKLSTFVLNGWDVGTIWQRCQVEVSAISRVTESSDSVVITQQNYRSISPSIPLYSAFFTSSLWLKSFALSLTNQYKHTARRALGTFCYSFIYLKAKGV
jgi:hypothetical protein